MPPSGGTPGSAAEDRLSAFIRQYLDEHDESERALARRAMDPTTGLTLQHGWINQLVLGRVTRAPELWRLRALAVAMGVPAERLARFAAIQWLGVDVAEVDGADGEKVAISVPPDLSPEDRERFIRMAEDIARHLTK